MTLPSTAFISDADYCAIEGALQSTEKGRRFLRVYAGRSRSLESVRLLKSISRLHRAALGTPGLNAEVCRDLASILKSVASHRRKALECGEGTARSNILMSGLEEIEACLIVLIELLEERAFESLSGGLPASPPQPVSEAHSLAYSAKLFDELSGFSPSEPQ